MQLNFIYLCIYFWLASSLLLGRLFSSCGDWGLCDPMHCSPPGSSVHGILQARILEWVAISFSRAIFPTQGSNPGLLRCSFIYLSIKHVVLFFIKESLINFTETREMWQQRREKFLLLHRGLPWLLSGKEPACQRRRRRFHP